MREIFPNIIVLILLFLTFGFKFESDKPYPIKSDVTLTFITYNGYGNNLFIDNVTLGKRYENDVAVLSVNNIKTDTTFYAGNNEFSLQPEVCIANVGTNSVNNSFIATLHIQNINYKDSIQISSLQNNSVAYLYFDTIIVNLPVSLDIIVYISLTNDTNKFNDTLKQNSVILPAVKRNILIEEFTSTTSNGCAVNNPFLDAFINLHLDDICAIKYHLGIPAPGNDSMYLANQVESDSRKNYYYITSVPASLIDGNSYINFPYYRDSNLIIPYDKRISIGSPVSVSCKDSLLENDSIKTTVSITNLYRLPEGSYRLRSALVERLVIYNSPPGNNGETNFYDVFRKFITDTNGIELNKEAGSYNYTIKTDINSNWTDSMIYSVTFVQNDVTKEIINATKGKSFVKKIFDFTPSVYNLIYYKPASVNSYFGLNKYFFPLYKTMTDSILDAYYLESFESHFPPDGWKLYNSDGWITFSQAENVNGISFDGSKCTLVQFYYYSLVGHKDTLISKTFHNISAEDTLSFDYSYAQYLSSYADSLTVNISTDGGTTNFTIFERGGLSLSTSEATTLPHFPVASNQWQRFTYPMSGIIPQDIPSNIIPSKYELKQNYPNPFNAKTRIDFSVPVKSFVKIIIYDIRGRSIIDLVNKEYPAGNYHTELSGENLSSGVYFYKMISNNFSQTKKIILLK